MKMFNVLKGRKGEDLAQKYLKKNGYKILEQNYKTKVGEIDIIAKKDDVLIFFEVKSRSNYDFGMPCEAVDYKKIKKIRQSANLYMINNNLLNQDISFDIIEILLKDNAINHIKSAF